MRSSAVRRAVWIFLAAISAVRVLPADEAFHLDRSAHPGSLFDSGSHSFRLSDSSPLDSDVEESAGALPAASALSSPQPGPAEPAPPSIDVAAPRVHRGRMALVTTGVLVGSAVSALGVGHGHQAFHFGTERFFEKNTYAGGADKASHFVFYNGLSRELGVAYSRMGYSRDQSLLLGAGVAVAAGLLVEVGDGLTVFGFAWEDLLMDTLGAGTAALVTRYGLDDTIGFRFGKVSAETPPACCRTSGVGKDYSTEIYTADLKLAGAARRLRLDPGIGRFLLLSMTYGSKGYRFSQPEVRQRNVGIELGLNIPQILTEVGVRNTTWWGRVLFIVFDFVRIPFTSFGFHYDLNHSKWNGPDAGNVFRP